MSDGQRIQWASLLRENGKLSVKEVAALVLGRIVQIYSQYLTKNHLHVVCLSFRKKLQSDFERIKNNRMILK